MKRALIVVFVTLCGCTTRLHYDYFEPYGLDSVVSHPPQAPKNVATLRWDGCELQVRAEVGREDRVVVTMRAFLPPGTQAAFSGDRARLLVEGVEEELMLSWQEWTLSDGVGARREVAFDVPLKSQSFAKRPSRKGIENMGRYETTITLPVAHSNAREFALVLPAPFGRSPMQLTFVRKTADYKVSVPIQ